MDAGVLLVYAGLSVGLAGLFSLAIPLRFLGIRTRRAAAFAALGGAVLLFAGLRLPAPLRSSGRAASRLDELIPEFQFHEFHEVRVRASSAEVFRAIRSVTAREIRFFRVLTWLRSPHFSRARENILAPPADQPVLDVALRTGFVLLAEEPGREIVFGTALCRGSCRVAMNFRIAEEGGGRVRLTTETRILALGDPARRQFGAYWRVIFPGSALIRRMWLDAIRRRAERPRSACVRELEAFARPVDDALARFEAAPPPGSQAAGEILLQTRTLRENLERASLDEKCAARRREVLIFFNHVLLAFEEYSSAGLSARSDREKLDSILRRARVHESRGLSTLDD